MQEQHPRHKHPDRKYPPKRDDETKCKENNTATQKAINTERWIYCDELKTAGGEVDQWEENYLGLEDIKAKKKCLFIWTEKNYQIFRNLEISTGVSLLQFNESIKESTVKLLKDNKSLSDSLKDVLKKVKEAKAKIYELRDEACDLKNCVHEACNCTQWGILTGDFSNCKGEQKGREQNSHYHPPKECEGIKEKFDDLFCIPKALAGDIDSIFKASADVVGIQVFSNINTLETLQKTLYENAKAFDKHLQETIKKGQEDLKKAQEDLVKTVQDYSKSKATLYWKRSVFEGVFEAVSFFCCPDCGCVEKDHKCEERLKKCKEEICNICEEVKDTFCADVPKEEEPQKQAY